MNLPDIILLEQTGKDKGLPLFHRPIKTVNERKDWMNEKSKHFRVEHFLNLIGILGFYTEGLLKKVNKNNFKVQSSKLL